MKAAMSHVLTCEPAARNKRYNAAPARTTLSSMIDAWIAEREGNRMERYPAKTRAILPTRFPGIRDSIEGSASNTPTPKIGAARTMTWGRRISVPIPPAYWNGKVARPIRQSHCTPTTRSNNAQRAASVIERPLKRRSAAILAASPARPIGAAAATKPEEQVNLNENHSEGASLADRSVAHRITRCRRIELSGYCSQ